MRTIVVSLFIALVGCGDAATHNGIIGANNPGGIDARGDGATKMDGKMDGSSGACANPMSNGVLATWDFTGEAGNQASTAVKTTAIGVTGGAFTRSSDITASSAANTISSNNWPQVATLDTSKGYYTLSITPPSGCSMSLTALAIDATRSGSGPAMGATGTSADSFGTTVSINTNATSTPALAVTGATGAVEIRVFGFNASSSAGTLHIQNTFTVSGSLQ